MLRQYGKKSRLAFAEVSEPSLDHDVAGVVRVGPKAHNFKVGDGIYARADDFCISAFAEFIAIKTSSVTPKPTTRDMAAAASIPLVSFIVEGELLRPFSHSASIVATKIPHCGDILIAKVDKLCPEFDRLFKTVFE